MKMLSAEIATSRFAYGANQKDLSNISHDPLQWLAEQLTPLTMPHSWHTLDAIQAEANYRMAKKQDSKVMAEPVMMNMMDEGQAKNMRLPSQKARRQAFKLAKESQISVIKAAAEKNNGFQYRLLDFFSNHFSVSQTNPKMRLLAPTLEAEAIAPNLSAKFSDMLMAVIKHPAMIYYLNNEQSVGDRSAIAKKRKNKGLNENLAREILELHTLGVNSTYSQTDVKELARAISGWSVNFNRNNKDYGFEYRKWAHEPGNRIILGNRYPAGEIEQGERILFDLANHSDTAVHVCFKLARHFIADNPDLHLVTQMATTWMKTQGELRSVILTMLNHPSAWDVKAVKYKTPRHFVISSLRASRAHWLAWAAPGVLEQMGQAPFNAGSPAGYADIADSWNGGKALVSRVEWSGFIAAKVKQEPMPLAENALGTRLSKTTRQAIQRAESRQQAMSLLLMSPEFQFV
ncbi:DUF1800 domain-containing protein [Gayadomonas joobiniege]|uniref:DUF1800 domain-containing protein n=1 Tax=Gayadomonas joobiniege TaxID=1234606 RepID=UPI00036DBD07|nr:DUF1800 domain-containing protein [Gayadomonas joobiniege]